MRKDGNQAEFLQGSRRLEGRQAGAVPARQRRAAGRQDLPHREVRAGELRELHRDQLRPGAEVRRRLRGLARRPVDPRAPHGAAWRREDRAGADAALSGRNPGLPRRADGVQAAGAGRNVRRDRLRLVARHQVQEEPARADAAVDPRRVRARGRDALAILRGIPRGEGVRGRIPRPRPAVLRAPGAGPRRRERAVPRALPRIRRRRRDAGRRERLPGARPLRGGPDAAGGADVRLHRRHPQIRRQDGQAEDRGVLPRDSAHSREGEPEVQVRGGTLSASISRASNGCGTRSWRRSPNA